MDNVMGAACRATYTHRMRSVRGASAALAIVVLGACTRGTPGVGTAARVPSGPRTFPHPQPRFEPRSETHLIPRELLVGDPDRAGPRLDPEGKLIGFGARGAKSSVFRIGPIDDVAKATDLMLPTAGRVKRWMFSHVPDHILYVQDRDGSEEWRTYSLDRSTKRFVELVPEGYATAEIAGISRHRPSEVAVAAARKGGEVKDLFVVDIRTGKATLVFANKERFIDWDIDDDFKVRVASRYLDSGELDVRRILPDGTSAALFRASLDDAMTTRTVGVDTTGKTLFMHDSRGRDTSALVEMELDTGKTTVLAENPKADITSVLVHPTTGRPQLAFSDPGKRVTHPLDREVDADLASLAKDGRVIDITSRSLDDSKWIVYESAPQLVGRYSLFDRKTKKRTELYTDRADLENKPLVPMDVVHVRARDGLDLVGYLSVPRASRRSASSVLDTSFPAPLPMVLFVHGGPWDRDHWEMSNIHQLLANRGYAVLSLNFRGSTGFGKRHLNAGNHEWGGKMQDDLVDGVRWAIDQRIADPSRIAIFGGSYGGYASLVGMTRDKGLFACGVDVVGPSNLVTFSESIPPSWRPFFGQYRLRIGDPTTEAGRKDLLARSPLLRAGVIDKPLLIVQGKNDPRVKERESTQIAEALAHTGVAVTYLLYDNEGHGFSHAENSRSFVAVMEVFLSQCIGGAHEPIGGALEHSSIRAVIGGEHITGLAKAALGAE